MAKNTKVNAKEEKEKLAKYMAKNPNAWNTTMGIIPLDAGAVLAFSGKIEEQVSTTPGVANWMGFVTEQGYAIGLRQISRRGNGLIFPSNITNSDDALNYFIDACASYENGLPLVVKEVKKIESSSRKGKNSYIVFEEFRVEIQQ